MKIVNLKANKEALFPLELVAYHALLNLERKILKKSQNKFANSSSNWCCGDAANMVKKTTKKL